MKRSKRCSINRLGRLVIPSQIRKQLDIREDSPVEIFSENEVICIRKHPDACIFCKTSNNLVDFKDQKICKTCLREVGNKKSISTN